MTGAPTPTAAGCEAATFRSVRWRVANSIGAEGLPVEAWAEAARKRLLDERAVEHVAVAALWEPDEVDLKRELAVLSVDVVLEGADAHSAAAQVKKIVVAALWDVVEDEEAGWTAYDWEAVPADN